MGWCIQRAAMQNTAALSIISSVRTIVLQIQKGKRLAAGMWSVDWQRQRLDTALIVGDWREDHTQPATTALIEELTLNLNKNQETKQNQLCQNLIWFYVYCLYCPFRYVSAAPRLCSGGGWNCVQQSFKRRFVITDKAFSFTIEFCVIKCSNIQIRSMVFSQLNAKAGKSNHPTKFESQNIL